MGVKWDTKKNYRSQNLQVESTRWVNLEDR